MPVDVDVASEFRYRAPPLPVGGLGLLVSQSRRDRRYAWRRCATCSEAGQHVLSRA